jgi:hypothetical protein
VASLNGSASPGGVASLGGSTSPGSVASPNASLSSLADGGTHESVAADAMRAAVAAGSVDGGTNGGAASHGGSTLRGNGVASLGGAVA